MLLNHVVPTELMASGLFAAVDSASPKPAKLTTNLGKVLEVTTDNDDLFLTPRGTGIMSKVLVTDVETCVGTVHVVETVLVPDMPEMEVGVASNSGSDEAAEGDEGPVQEADDPEKIEVRLTCSLLRWDQLGCYNRQGARAQKQEMPMTN